MDSRSYPCRRKKRYHFRGKCMCRWSELRVLIGHRKQHANTGSLELFPSDPQIYRPAEMATGNPKTHNRSWSPSNPKGRHKTLSNWLLFTKKGRFKGYLVNNELNSETHGKVKKIPGLASWQPIKGNKEKAAIPAEHISVWGSCLNTFYCAESPGSL